jgi:hypothetical protein
MKAMLEPRMVAASIQVLASGRAGTAAAPDWITALSQGVLIVVMSVFHHAPGAQGSRLIEQPWFDLETERRPAHFSCK